MKGYQNLNQHRRWFSRATGRYSSSSSVPNKALGNRCDKNVQEEVKITTSIFNKIDWRIDGVPQSDILQDVQQMRNISEAIQQLQRIGNNLGDDHTHQGSRGQNSQSRER